MKCTNNADSGGVKIRKSDESNYLQKKTKNNNNNWECILTTAMRAMLRMVVVVVFTDGSKLTMCSAPHHSFIHTVDCRINAVIQWRWPSPDRIHMQRSRNVSAVSRSCDIGLTQEDGQSEGMEGRKEGCQASHTHTTLFYLRSWIDYNWNLKVGRIRIQGDWGTDVAYGRWPL